MYERLISAFSSASAEERTGAHRGRPLTGPDVVLARGRHRPTPKPDRPRTPSPQADALCAPVFRRLRRRRRRGGGGGRRQNWVTEIRKRRRCTGGKNAKKMYVHTRGRQYRAARSLILIGYFVMVVWRGAVQRARRGGGRARRASAMGCSVGKRRKKEGGGHSKREEGVREAPS